MPALSISEGNLHIDHCPPLFGGVGANPVFALHKDALPPGLIYLPTSLTHGVIAPLSTMPYQAYLKLLASTYLSWRLVGGTTNGN